MPVAKPLADLRANHNSKWWKKPRDERFAAILADHFRDKERIRIADGKSRSAKRRARKERT